MSDIPSLFFGVVAFIFYLKYERKEEINTFLLGFIASMSILFRETNILLFLPIIFFLRKSFILYFGLLFGLFFRLLGNNLFFGNPFFIKSSGFGFTGSLFFEHSLILLFFVFICIPGSIFFIKEIKENLSNRIPMIIVVFLFFLCYSMYDYNSLQTSGSLRGTLLYLRFYLPILPFIIYLGSGFTSELRNKGWFNYLRVTHSLFVLFLIIFLNKNFNQVYRDQLRTKEIILNHKSQNTIFRDYNLNQYKLINYFHFEKLPRSIMYNKTELICYLEKNKSVILLSGNNFEPTVAYKDLMEKNNLNSDLLLRNKSYSAFLIESCE